MSIVAVFGASASEPGDGHYEAGLLCGRLLADAGFGVATGGYGGLMEAVSAGAGEGGAEVIGVTAPTVFQDRTGANAFVTEERRAGSLTERVHELIDVAVASIALHGSIGTLTELTMAWNLAFVARYGGERAKPVVAVGPRWRHLVATLAAELDTDPGIVTCVDDVHGAVAEVRRRLG